MGIQLLEAYSLSSKEQMLKTAKKTVAIFGGSFDPITNAHLTSACEILHHRYAKTLQWSSCLKGKLCRPPRKADEVWLIPCGPRPDKPSLKTPAVHRLIMCHLAVNASFGTRFPIKVNDIETRDGGVALGTYDLMSRLKKEHPEYNFVFVVG
jgi:nicotinic acid mononucleotide adenylyltransferase